MLLGLISSSCCLTRDVVYFFDSGDIKRRTVLAKFKFCKVKVETPSDFVILLFSFFLLFFESF